MTAAEQIAEYNWPEHASCRGAVEVFGGGKEEQREPPRPTRQQLAYCEYCPVRCWCLQHALAHDEPYGVWGGLSTYQRRQLSRRRRRVCCPGCDSFVLVEIAGCEFCPACGVSWAVAP